MTSSTPVVWRRLGYQPTVHAVPDGGWGWWSLCGRYGYWRDVGFGCERCIRCVQRLNNATRGDGT